MRGSIRQKTKDTWQIQIYTGVGPDGKRQRHFETIKGRKGDAQKRLTELLSSLDKGTYMKPSKTTFEDYLKIWLDEYARNSISPRGFERYKGIIEKSVIPDMGKIILTQLKPEHIQRHYTALQDKGLSPGTVKYHHAVIHKALQTAVKRGLIIRNPADSVDVPRKGHNEMQIWNEYEVNQFLEAAKNSQYYALFYIALFTGMRRGELLGLRWSDIDFLFCQLSVNRTLHQLKNGTYIYTQPKSAKSKRTIALSPSAMVTLNNHKDKQEAIYKALGKPLTENELVFCTAEGKPFRPNTITRAWSELAKKAGVTVIRLHDARHTHASLMLKQGIHPKIVQERLGHSTIAMTLDIYSHVTPGLQQAAAQAFDNLVIQEINANLTPFSENNSSYKP